MSKPIARVWTDLELPLEPLVAKVEILRRDFPANICADVFILAFRDTLRTIELSRRTAQECPHSKRVVVFESAQAAKYHNISKRAGVNGFCSLASGSQALLEAVEAVLNGTDYWDPNLPALCPTSPNPAPEYGLTDREIAVIRLINCENSVISSKLQMKPRTVEKHIECICAKLESPESC